AHGLTAHGLTAHGLTAHGLTAHGLTAHGLTARHTREPTARHALERSMGNVCAGRVGRTRPVGPRCHVS
ncbi:hypothetical protein AB0J13_30310, partial [Streptomyces anulatus]|uniref:hypothetical protein n=1 Tax=Streptomyces anulatus TaxID=1892 RepID=UPI0033C3FFAA